MDNAVTGWFGEKFSELDPLLQQLHREGGVLGGRVLLEYGEGPARPLANRLAKKLGLPPDPGEFDFQVAIEHSPDKLIWTRTFDRRHTMKSQFIPQGHYPDGCWTEITGPTALELGVKIIDGGWYWIQRRICIHGVSIPGFLMPKSIACKYIDNGEYMFVVEFSVPVLGRLLGYRGALRVIR